jgi:hypothetical protein
MTDRVEHPACDCCPHTELSDLERDRLAREVWDGCPDSGCLREFCRFCQPEVRSMRSMLHR